MKHTFNRTLLVILTLLALAFGSLGVAPAEAAPATQPVYLRSINGSPWGQATNEQAMNTAFGAGNWTALFYETVDPAVLFSPTYDLIFIEGSDSYATQMENFLNANRTLMENWVNSGGRLFLNSAPNQDNGMLYGFGGVQLLYPNYNSNTGIAVNPGHAIFNGPYTPAGTNYTGGSFSHASIAGGGITPLMSGDSGRIPLAEKQWGNGWVLFGGMTTTNYHSPQPNAMNLRANMLAYLKNQGAGFGLGVDPSSYDFGNQGTGTSSAPYTFTATNGDTPTTIGTLSISGEFSLSDDQCSGQTLGAGVSCTFDVVFSPATSGAKSGSVSIPNNGPASPIVVNLSGTGIVPPPTVDILSPITSNGFDLFSTIDIADPQGDPLSGSVDIVRTKTPSSVTFQTLTTCGSPNTLNLTLNGVTVGTSATPANCTCTPGVVTDVFSGSPITTNYLPFANNTWGYNSSGASTYTAWAKAIIQFSDGSSQTACLFDRTGSGCTNTDLCTGYLYGPASGTSIQPSTGTLFASQAYSNSSLPASLDTSALASGSYTLQASASDGSTTVTDSEPFTLAGEANLYINGGPSDTTAPSVDSFAATSPSPSLDIPITAFTASDDTGVTGYLITESATPPAAGDAGWSGTAPTTYTVAAAGTYDLYPWAKDAAGNVSAVCGPVTVDVIVANALDFDGANDYVDNGAGLLAQPFTTMTVEFWYKTPVGTGTYMQTVGRAYTTWEVQFHQLGTINLYINSQEYQSTAQRPLDSNWHHLAVTFNDATNEIKYYIDGAQLGSTITATQSIPNNANPLNIGRRSVYGGEYFNGTIDEVRIWDVVRTQGEIQASMNSELSAQAGLVALYHFNQGVPNGNNAGVTTLLDEGGNSRNGTLYNFALNGATSNWVDGYVAPSDTTPPVLSLPGNMTVEATGPAGAVVTFSATATDETSPANPAVACDANSGDTFPLGTTTVTCSATDDAGNTANGSFDITVEDTTAPVVSVPADITTEATGPAGAAVTFAAATASDIVDGPLTPVCDANSGDTFPLGTTTVTCSATDNAGNKGSAS
ncbi:MAG: LamG-like jellyroll fold domain-containing protein, partial [Chloroflexota bacterium]